MGKKKIPSLSAKLVVDRTLIFKNIRTYRSKRDPEHTYILLAEGRLDPDCKETGLTLHKDGQLYYTDKEEYSKDTMDLHTVIFMKVIVDDTSRWKEVEQLFNLARFAGTGVQLEVGGDIDFKPEDLKLVPDSNSIFKPYRVTIPKNVTFYPNLVTPAVVIEQPDLPPGQAFTLSATLLLSDPTDNEKGASNATQKDCVVCGTELENDGWSLVDYCSTCD